MRRIAAAVGVACVVTVTGASPAHAIVGEAVPDFEHSYVGLAVMFDAAGAPVQRCTGSLLTDEVFLTAGHCVTLQDGTPAGSARIWFEQDAGADFDPVTGEPASSGFPVAGGVSASTLVPYGPADAPAPQTFDAGLILLDEPVTDVYPEITDYVMLGDPGTLEDYVAVGGATTVVSGYGLSNGSGDPAQLVDERSRLMAGTDVTGLNTPVTGPYNVALAGTQDGEGGGACFGDSGGPLLLAGSDISVGVISSGTPTCTGTFYSYRTDTGPVLSWILDTAGSEADEVAIVDVAVAS
jgi:hypothetical protein